MRPKIIFYISALIVIIGAATKVIIKHNYISTTLLLLGLTGVLISLALYLRKKAITTAKK
jgi:CHASE1-domain containing sensor protein